MQIRIYRCFSSTILHHSLHFNNRGGGSVHAWQKPAAAYPGPCGVRDGIRLRLPLAHLHSGLPRAMWHERSHLGRITARVLAPAAAYPGPFGVRCHPDRTTAHALAPAAAYSKPCSARDAIQLGLPHMHSLLQRPTQYHVV